MEFSTVRNHQSSSRKRIIVFIVIGLVAAVIAAGIFMWATAGNKGVVTDSPDKTKERGSAVKDLSGTYIFFRYASTYDLKKSALGDADKEAYQLTASTNYEKHIAVAVSLPANGQLDNFSPYIARKTHPELYDRKDFIVAGDPAVLFIKHDLTERTVLITHNGMVATLSFVSQGSAEELQPEVDQLLTTFSWRQ